VNHAYWQAARQVCTPRQLRVLELRERHRLSLRDIAHAEQLSPWTVRDHLEAAYRRVSQELGTDTPRRRFDAEAGDGRTLRGIPAIGRGVAGVIPGTSPDRLTR